MKRCVTGMCSSADKGKERYHIYSVLYSPYTTNYIILRVRRIEEVDVTVRL
jgi:hypothetical protein